MITQKFVRVPILVGHVLYFYFTIVSIVMVANGNLALGCVLPSLVFRSSPQRWPNKPGKNVRPSVRTYVHKYDVRGRWNIHDYMSFKVIQGQSQGEEMTSVPYRDYFFFVLSCDCGRPSSCCTCMAACHDNACVVFGLVLMLAWQHCSLYSIVQ